MLMNSQLQAAYVGMVSNPSLEEHLNPCSDNTVSFIIAIVDETRITELPGLPDIANDRLQKILELLQRQEKRALEEAEEARLKKPFEHAAKTSLEGVTSGSLIVRMYRLWFLSTYLPFARQFLLLR
jgi:hypothetical protein